MKHKVEIHIPEDWPFEHIPSLPEYDEDGDIEVDNFTCENCEYHNSNQCKCINHDYVHFFKQWFYCDVYTPFHTICRQFKPSWQKYPYGCLEWDAIGGFDEWQKLWRKQWHPRTGEPYSPNCALIRAHTVEGRDLSDDIYTVSYDDFVNCNIIREDGIHCLNYRHIERTRDPMYVTGYKWVSEGPGLWVPWEDNRYDAKGNL